jgi:hypothetical protein
LMFCSFGATQTGPKGHDRRAQASALSLSTVSMALYKLTVDNVSPWDAENCAYFFGAVHSGHSKSKIEREERKKPAQQNIAPRTNSGRAPWTRWTGWTDRAGGRRVTLGRARRGGAQASGRPPGASLRSNHPPTRPEHRRPHRITFKKTKKFKKKSCKHRRYRLTAIASTS